MSPGGASLHCLGSLRHHRNNRRASDSNYSGFQRRRYAGKRPNDVPFLEIAMSEKILVVDMSTGVAEMDRLHYDFFEALSALAAMPDNEFMLGFGGFICHVERAFRMEEQWMESSDFAADKSHREQHARVLSALHHLHSRVLAGDIAT